MTNRIQQMEELTAAGVPVKEALLIINQQMKDKAAFFTKMVNAQQNLGMILKDTKDQRGRQYAGVDQFVGKAQRALNEAGLTMFESHTAVCSKGEKERSWMLDCIIGDADSGFSVGLAYEVPINSQAWDREPEKAVGAADSYALKYLTRGVLFAERSENDPDRNDDPDHQRPDAPSAPRAGNITKKLTPKKVSVADRKKQTKARFLASKTKLGVETFNKVISDNSINNIEGMERTADILDARIRLEAIITQATTIFGQPKVDGWLELYRPFTIQPNIGDASKALTDEISKGNK